ncbi:MAG: rubrerythrin family protein [Deltaproteobacteria bacterium]|nr:rubrerythrin family protein [Deltaproteobacteria bacterium]MBW2122415.1 rubrerythrin family protein [Deltaproteobacteria bacterium]
MSNTRENLERAYRDECETHMRYKAFARQAEEEGFPNIARLFRGTAEGETVHALNQLAALEGVRSTKECLKLAIEEEEGDFFRMYPRFIEDARAEDRTEAVLSLTWIREAERAHFGLLGQALEDLERGGDIEAEDYYLCTNCGLVVAGGVPSSCPVCKAPRTAFKPV